MHVITTNHMGDDLTVVNAARVSFAKESAAQDDEYTDVEYDSWLGSIPVLSKSDKRLINYLGKHNHWSPFGHCQLQFRIKAPVFVARQLVKHQVGLTWNEVSRRYVDIEPEFYTPEVWRGVAENKKQGSSDMEIDINPSTIPGRSNIDDYQHALKNCKWTYEHLLRLGVAPEQARMVLPQSMMTEWYWSGTLYAFARVCNLRCKDDVQFETRMIANQIDEQAKKLFPVSWEALRDNK
jgi:thymidylate synthase (FAD)